MYKKIFIYILLILLICLVASYYNKQQHINNTYNKERFFAQQYDPNNDGNMKFNYLVSPNYTTNILSRYYINDDTRVNNVRVINHPNQNIKNIGYNSKYYGNLGGSNVLNVVSNSFYNAYGIRL